MIGTVNRCARRALLLGGGLLAAALQFAGSAGAETSGMTMSGGPSMAHMGPSGASHGAMHMSMGGVSMTAGSHTTNILPNWLAVIWLLAFLAIIVIHARHVLESKGQQRVWHSGHVFMAVGMAFMYAPASVDSFNIPSGFWSLAFANGAIAILLFVLVQLFAGNATNLLWLTMAFDLGAMAYMWSPSGFQAPVTWVLVAYFTVQSALWASNRIRKFDERTIFGGGGTNIAVTPEGTMTATVAEPLICFKDLRVSMSVMTLGMAYMFAAMQLVM
jgi:hypothetical protein